MAKGQLGAVPFEIADPERIPAGRYHDPDFFDFERRKLWPRVWQMACRLEQVAHVGDWIEYSNLGQSVIVVRTKDGIRAFHNACRHRGVALAREGGHGNCKAQGFICPFHGWRWDTEGRSTFVYGRHMFSEGQLDAADLALPRCRTEELLGCVFINFDDDARPLRESLGASAIGLEAYQTARMHAEWWYTTILPANWKIAMEAFMEGYHVMRTHPQLQRTVPTLYNGMYGHDTGGVGPMVNPDLSTRENIVAQFHHLELLSEGMAGMCHAKDVATARSLLDIDLPDDPAEAVRQWFTVLMRKVTEEGRARGEGTADLLKIAAETPVNAVEFVFPNYFLLPFLSSMAAYRIRPLGPESCIFELWSHTLFPEGQEPEPIMEPTFLPYDSPDYPPIPRQDYANIPKQQRGVHAKGFEFMRLSRDIEGLISNYHQLIDGYLRDQSVDDLSRAMTSLASNFDGGIKYLELGRPTTRHI